MKEIFFVALFPLLLGFSDLPTSVQGTDLSLKNQHFVNWTPDLASALLFRVSPSSSGPGGSELQTVLLSETGGFSAELITPKDSQLGNVTGISEGCTGNMTISDPTAKMGFVHLMLVNQDGSFNGAVLAANAGPYSGASAGKKSYSFLYLDRETTLKGSLMCGFKLNFDVNALQGWNLITATVVTPDSFQLTASQTLPADLKWWALNGSK